MSKRKCGIFTPCHEQGCMDCARRRVEHVLSLALAKSDPKWREPGGGPAELIAYRDWLEATVADVVTAATSVQQVSDDPAPEPRVWRHRGTDHDPDPGDGVRVKDRDGDIWTPRDRGPGDRVWESPDTAPFRWDYVLKKWGPLTEVVESASRRSA